MQIEKITELQLNRTAVKRETLSQEQLQREFDYHRSMKLLDKLLYMGFISQEEFEKINRLNRKNFSPLGYELMP